ncbi:response regulator [Candidatus Kryptonium thompsonii]|uniref:response regulator n=1 Tax=Candidatus Kryptonium thompsonii TaxID=1633631 RepID=UPI00210058A2|nr:response regulator [Candidatus Kryptonium thompsoni]
MTDLWMPILDGVEMIKIIRKIDPNVKILLTSGLDSPIEVLPPNISFHLKKPFDAVTLLKKVSELLKD